MMDVAFMFQEVLLSLLYIHSKGVSHRGLTLETILAKEKKGSDPTLSTLQNLNFVISHFFESSGIFRRNIDSNSISSLYFMAPERVQGRLVRDANMNKAADMWSMGVLLYILICGQPPFVGSNNEELMTMIVEGDFRFASKEWDNLLDAKNLVADLLKYEPAERLDAS
mmetsp:Transcript_44718/g.32755  ORF Transcript_44718/g.32755 Transcript_44718/m.32755 type:complete len:168 (-) Transcript_44718:632-1135(-)